MAFVVKNIKEDVKFLIMDRSSMTSAMRAWHVIYQQCILHQARLLPPEPTTEEIAREVVATPDAPEIAPKHTILESTK